MTHLVRVRHKTTRHEYTVSAEEAAIDQLLEVTGQPATDINGTPLPPKPRQEFGAKHEAAKEGK